MKFSLSIIMLTILATLALMLPKHHQWYQVSVGSGPGRPYSYGVVECGHNDLCLGA